MGAWFRRRLYLKGRAEVCVTYIYPLILYRLSVLPISAKRLTRFHQLLSLGRPIVRMEVSTQRSCRGEMCLSHLLSHKRVFRLAFLSHTMAGIPVWGPCTAVIFSAPCTVPQRHVADPSVKMPSSVSVEWHWLKSPR